MSAIFIGRFVASILVLLMASSLLLTYGQSQSEVLSDEDEADILETFVKLEIKPLESEFSGVRMLLSGNISSLSATRMAKYGFSMIAARDIQRRKVSYLFEYLAVRKMYRRNGVVVLAFSVVKEGRPCFAPSVFSERFFTYEYEKSPEGWVGRLANRRPPPFSVGRQHSFRIPGV